MFGRRALSTAQAAIIVAVIAIAAVGGSYAFIASTPPQTVIRTQVQTQTQLQTQVRTVTQVQKLESVTTILGFLPGPRYAHYYVAKGLGFYADEGLDVTIISGSGGVFAGTQVETKKVTFGDSGSDVVYLNNAKGGNIRAVLQFYELDPAGIAVWKDKNVKTPKDLEGLKFASAPFSTIIPLLKAVMPIYGASFDKVNFSPVDPAAQTSLFIRGEVDFIPSFWENNKASIDKEAAKIRREVVHYLMADWGYLGYGTAVFTHADTIKGNPSLVERFVRATTKGILAMRENPERAADITLKFEPGLDRELLMKGIEDRKRLDNPDFKVTDEKIKATMDFTKKWFNPARELTPEEIWDFSFVKKR